MQPAGDRSLPWRPNVNALLDVRELTASYGEAIALDGVNLHVREGEFITVIGPNGAGKSTLLNVTMGIHAPRQGAIIYCGAPLGSEGIERRVAMGIVLVPERRELFGRLSVEDNLRLGGYTGRDGSAPSALREIYALFPALRERQRQAVYTLSGGEQQMVALGRALMARPRILMLDEPSMGLAPRAVQDIFGVLTSLKASGLTAILVEQNARLALDIADRAYVLEAGEIVLSGNAEELKSDPRVVEAYLGVGGRYGAADLAIAGSSQT